MLVPIEGLVYILIAFKSNLNSVQKIWYVYFLLQYTVLISWSACETLAGNRNINRTTKGWRLRFYPPKRERGGGGAEHGHLKGQIRYNNTSLSLVTSLPDMVK